jgi:NADH-quinone oxidoreductase subunit H
MLAGSMSFADICTYSYSEFGLGRWVLLTSPAWVLFITCIVAEVERTPFDIPEADAELVEGWTTEYGGMRFVLMLGAEYVRGWVGAAVATLIFFGGWYGPAYGTAMPSFWIFDNSWLTLGLLWFTLKTWTIFCLFVFIRGTVPRVRIDQILNIGWKRLLPWSVVACLLPMLLITNPSGIGDVMQAILDLGGLWGALGRLYFWIAGVF